MTYCVAMSLEAGILFAPASPTHAGADPVWPFSTIRGFFPHRGPVILLLSSGNLSLTQN